MRREDVCGAWSHPARDGCLAHDGPPEVRVGFAPVSAPVRERDVSVCCPGTSDSRHFRAARRR